MRHQHLLIRRLGLMLRSRMTKSGHLAQAIYHEHRGNCLPPRNGCSPQCTEARELVALTEPFMPAAVPKPRPVLVVGRIPRLIPKRRVRPAVAVQPDLFADAYEQQQARPPMGATG